MPVAHVYACPSPLRRFISAWRPTGRLDERPCGRTVRIPAGAIGYGRNGGTDKRLLSPRRPRLCSRRTPSLLCRRAGAPDKRSAPLQYRRDPRWMGARGVR
jgi:hypothetical protein